jgi:hypothetical protein
MTKIRREEDAEKLFAVGMKRLALLPTIRARCDSQLKVTTVVRLIWAARKAANPNARSIPFRSRKRLKLVDTTSD